MGLLGVSASRCLNHKQLPGGLHPNGCHCDHCCCGALMFGPQSVEMDMFEFQPRVVRLVVIPRLGLRRTHFDAPRCAFSQLLALSPALAVDLSVHHWRFTCGKLNICCLTCPLLFKIVDPVDDQAVQIGTAARSQCNSEDPDLTTAGAKSKFSSGPSKKTKSF